MIAEPITAPAITLTRARSIRGWMSDTELSWLARTARMCGRVVEVGSFAGRSTRAMADNMATGSLLISVDPLDPTRAGGGLRRVPPESKHDQELVTKGDGDRVRSELEFNLSDHVESGRVQLWRSASVDGAARFAREVGGANADFVFLDGDHSYEAVKADIAAWLPLVREGGMLAGHDYYSAGVHAGVKRAVDERFSGRFGRPAGSIWAVTI